MTDISLYQLTAFTELARTGNVSQTAHTLSISQPTLSRHIAQLEHELGVVLFDRTHRPMTLTDAGRFFLEHITPNLDDMKQIITLTQNFKTKDKNVLTIGFVASVLYGLLPKIVATLKQYVDLDVRLMEIGSDEQIDALKSGEIDAGFGRFLYHDRFTEQIFLRDERLVVALPHAHPLARLDKISLPELLNETLILYHRTPISLAPNHRQDPILHLFYTHHLTPKETTKARDIQIALGLVSVGVGITIVPDGLKNVRTDELTYRPLAHDDATSPIYLNTLAHDPHPHIKALFRAIYQVYDDEKIAYDRV